MTSTYTQVIVPLDGSERGEMALPAAVRLARCAGARLHLVRAVPRRHVDEAALAADLVRPSDHAAARAATYLKRIAERLRTRTLAVDVTLVRGDLPDALVTLAAPHESSIAVMCSRGRAGRGRWLIGSAARRIVGRSPVPVLLVRTDGRPLPPASRYDDLPQTALHVLVPLDGTPASEAALAPALDLLNALAMRGRGRLHLMHVAPAFGGAWGLDEPAARAYIQSVGARAVELLPSGAGHRVTWSVDFETEPSLAIVRRASQDDGEGPQADVIVMATTRWSRLRRILGGISEQVLHASRTPIMLVGQQVSRPAAGAKPRDPSAGGIDRTSDGRLDDVAAVEVPEDTSNSETIVQPTQAAERSAVLASRRYDR